MDLKRAFDRRLGTFIAPWPARRSRASRISRVLIGAGVATLIFAGGGLALDVESVAAANGGCGNVLTKLQMWSATKLSGDMTTLEIKATIAKIARESGCLGTKVDLPSFDKNATNPKVDQLLQTKPAPKAP